MANQRNPRNSKKPSKAPITTIGSRAPKQSVKKPRLNPIKEELIGPPSTSRRPTAWDRLRAQCVADEKGRYKTTDAMYIAVQIDKELQSAESKIYWLQQEVESYKQHLRAIASRNGL